MNKKIVLAISLTISLFTTNLCAQSNTGLKSKALPINSQNDSISYAYGINQVESGLKKYLEQSGITNENGEMSIFLDGLNNSLSSKGVNSSYNTGLAIGDQFFKMMSDFAKQAFEDQSADNFNLQLIYQGIYDALLEREPAFEDTRSVINKVLTESEKRYNEELDKLKAKQTEAENKFMAENKTKDGVVSLPSGLQYKIASKGNGEIPKKDDRVRVHYKGTLLDGTVFDNSYQRGQPLSLVLDQVIPGWVEALQLMPVGSKWIVYIPFELGYGQRGTESIPPYSTLIFEIDLLEIVK